MNRLWVQLSLAFTLVVLVSAVLLGIIANAYARLQRQSVADDFRTSIEESVLYDDQGLVTRLQAHFDARGSIEGAVRLLRDAERERRGRPFRLHSELQRPDGQTVYGRIPRGAEANATEIVFDEATLRVAIQLPNDNERRMPPPNNILSPEALLMLLGIFGTLLGIAVGVFLSRRIAAPLSNLAYSAQRVGARDFDMRVNLDGSREMQSVAVAFNDMVSQLQTSEQLRSNLIADVAHELRTPLTVMESNLRALIDDVYPLTKTEVLTLYDQTRQLSRMVNDLHELSLADAHELTFDFQQISLNAFLHQISDIFNPVAEAEGIAFQVTIPNEPCIVTGDRGRLSQVMQNLLVNALRHTPTDGQITLTMRQHDLSVHITVADTGEGIDAGHLSHIFERFYRVDPSRERGSGGAGLGLAIGKAIIEAHGGEITVASQTQPPSGTEFTIRLPLLTE